MSAQPSSVAVVGPVLLIAVVVTAFLLLTDCAPKRTPKQGPSLSESAAHDHGHLLGR